MTVARAPPRRPARTSRCRVGWFLLSGEHHSTKVTTPANNANARYPASRTATTGNGAVGELPATASAGVPTPKENAPTTGWPSAETTRQLTTYDPCDRCAGIGQVTVCPATAGSGVRTVAPLSSTSRIPSGIRLTASVNRIWTLAGAWSSWAPFAGVLATSSAWADAGEASSNAEDGRQ